MSESGSAASKKNIPIVETSPPASGSVPAANAGSAAPSVPQAGTGPAAPADYDDLQQQLDNLSFGDFYDDAEFPTSGSGPADFSEVVFDAVKNASEHFRTDPIIGEDACKAKFGGNMPVIAMLYRCFACILAVRGFKGSDCEKNQSGIKFVWRGFEAEFSDFWPFFVAAFEHNKADMYTGTTGLTRKTTVNDLIIHFAADIRRNCPSAIANKSFGKLSIFEYDFNKSLCFIRSEHSIVDGETAGANSVLEINVALDLLQINARGGLDFVIDKQHVLNTPRILRVFAARSISHRPLAAVTDDLVKAGKLEKRLGDHFVNQVLKAVEYDPIKSRDERKGSPDLSNEQPSNY